jgi:gamma-glutamylcyclotransferase (GGCT)/AIG2-like uncharacterized protein YtfP
MGDLLAVYGTLMDGLAPAAAPVLDGRVERLGPCRIPGRLYDCGPYPALSPEPYGPGVRGELLRLLDAGLWAELDEYEGCDPCDEAGSLFVRRRVLLLEPRHEAWVYHGGRVRRIAAVPSGDWRAHRAPGNANRRGARGSPERRPSGE